jgi:transcriptional regulator with XRE-family HTH domain
MANLLIGEKIRNVREARGKTQAQIAKSLGISVTSYAKLERGEVDMTLARLQRICNALNLKPFILFLNCNPVMVYGDKIDLNEYVN